MTCERCFHYKVCEGHLILNDIPMELCGLFKDKSRIVELPNVEIGQELFYVDRYTQTVESDIVLRLTLEQDDLGINTGIWSENNGFSEFFGDIGKTLFLTKEEAKAKLKELRKNATD